MKKWVNNSLYAFGGLIIGGVGIGIFSLTDEPVEVAKLEPVPIATQVEVTDVGSDELVPVVVYIPKSKLPLENANSEINMEDSKGNVIPLDSLSSPELQTAEKIDKPKLATKTPINNPKLQASERVDKPKLKLSTETPLNNPNLKPIYSNYPEFQTTERIDKPKLSTEKLQNNPKFQTTERIDKPRPKLTTETPVNNSNLRATLSQYRNYSNPPNIQNTPTFMKSEDIRSDRVDTTSSTYQPDIHDVNPKPSVEYSNSGKIAKGKNLEEY